MKPPLVRVTVVRTKTAPHYLAVYLDGVRILGDKPWGGGETLADEVLPLNHPNVRAMISLLNGRMRRTKPL